VWLGLERFAVDCIALFGQGDAKARFAIVGDWPLRAA
jgi:hypothetical protein